METRYMTYKNEEGQKERFYPVTHKNAVVGLEDLELNGDYVTSEPFTETEDDEMPPFLNKLAELEARIVSLETELSNAVTRLLNI